MTTSAHLLNTLRSRGLLYQHTEGLAEHLARGPLTAYCGFDPTAPSLHVGNLVPVMALAQLARAGHKVIAVVGGGTAMIGDPSGKSAERPLLSAGDVAANTTAIAAQLRAIVGDTLSVIDNADWLHWLGLIAFLRDVGKHFPVNQMLAKDTVKSRLETGISFTEFSYMLLQAYDYLQLFNQHGVTLQVGGSDQWGNITAGTELVRRAAGGEAHALTTPLLTTASGKKFGKTEEGAVWLDPGRTSPYAFYQFWINAEDADVGTLLRLFTLLPDAEIDALLESHTRNPGARTGQRRLAEEVTRRIHSGSVDSAIAVSDTIFDAERDPSQLRDDEFEMLKETVPSAKLRVTESQDLVGCVAELYKLSKGDVRRLIQQGGLSVNRVRVAPDKQSIVTADAIRGQWLLFRKGKRDLRLAQLIP